MRKYILDHFKPRSIYGGGGGKCQPIKANDYKGIDPNYNIRPSLLEIYEHSDYPRLQKACISSGGGCKYNCLTTEIAHRTNSYGLPHVLIIYEL